MLITFEPSERQDAEHGEQHVDGADGPMLPTLGTDRVARCVHYRLVCAARFSLLVRSQLMTTTQVDPDERMTAQRDTCRANRVNTIPLLAPSCISSRHLVAARATNRIVSGQTARSMSRQSRHRRCQNRTGARRSLNRVASALASAIFRRLRLPNGKRKDYFAAEFTQRK